VEIAGPGVYWGPRGEDSPSTGTLNPGGYSIRARAEGAADYMGHTPGSSFFDFVDFDDFFVLAGAFGQKVSKVALPE
jgi:hypothetical protein